MPENLCTGIAVVIDNEVTTDPDIKAIISKIENNGIPVYSFKSIKNARASLQSFRTINFLILDWRMHTSSADYESGLMPGYFSQLYEADSTDAIDFIKKLREICFVPVFIFTNEPEGTINDEIISKLRESQLYFDDETRNFIHIRNKSSILRETGVIEEINAWISKIPSLYLLKIWENELFKAKNTIFWELYYASNGSWPKMLWENFKKENEDPKYGLNDTLFQLLKAHIDLGALEEEKVLSKSVYDLEDVKKLLKGTMYCSNTLTIDKPGDIYKKGDTYYLNVRPECDTIPGRPECEYIYLIKGDALEMKKIPPEKKKELYNTKIGFYEKIGECFIFLFENEAEVINFKLNTLKVEKGGEWSAYKKCRLLPPYITHIQQKCSIYLSRVGKPRLPIQIENDFFPPATIPEIQSNISTNNTKQVPNESKS